MHPADTPDPLREQQRHELLQAGLDLLDQGITVFDADLRMVAWNQAFLRLLDFPPELAHVGSSFESFIRFNAERGEYGAGPVDALVAERLQKAQAFQSHATERNRPNGQILAVRGGPLPHDGFVTLYTDITAQRRYERLIREQNAELERRVAQRTVELQTSNRQLRSAHEANQQITAALRRSEERLRLITDAVPAMIAYFDGDQVYRYVNKGYADWFGHSKDRVIGRTIAAVVPPAVYAAIAPHVVVALQGQRVSYEYTLQRDQGPPMHARSELVPEVGPGGEVLGCFVLSVNISEIKAAQVALVQAQKMEAVVQLTGGLAHDFNNMLAVMIGNLAALRDRHPDNPELAEFLTPALKAAHSGAELIRRLLTFARQQPLAPQPVEVGELIEDAVQLLRRSMPDTVQVVVVPPAPGASPVRALTDAHQFESALVNLAINARDAMPEGGVLRIEAQPVRLDRLAAEAVEVAPGDYVRLSVTDTGIGMDSATQARVFEPFFTTKRFGSGSGLGLSMVYGFAKQSGGSVVLHSRPGQGTQVSLLLPQATDALPREAAAAELPAPGPATAQADRPLVLLVEDHDELRHVIRRQLVGLGYPVIEATHAQEALDLLQTVPDIGLLVSDIVMPGPIDGRALSRQARLSHPDMRILLISGYADEVNLPRENGGPRLLRKPFSSHELGDALEHLSISTSS